MSCIQYPAPLPGYLHSSRCRDASPMAQSRSFQSYPDTCLSAILSQWQTAMARLTLPTQGDRIIPGSPVECFSSLSTHGAE